MWCPLGHVSVRISPEARGGQETKGTFGSARETAIFAPLRKLELRSFQAATTSYQRRYRRNTFFALVNRRLGAIAALIKHVPQEPWPPSALSSEVSPLRIMYHKVVGMSGLATDMVPLQGRYQKQPVLVALVN